MSDSDTDDNLPPAINTSLEGVAAHFSTAAIPIEEGPTASTPLPPSEALLEACEAHHHGTFEDPAGNEGFDAAAETVVDRGGGGGQEFTDGEDARYMDAAAWF